MFRGTPQMYATDYKALYLTKLGMEKGFLDKLSLLEQSVFVMPLMHSENIDDQEDCVHIFNRLAS